MSATHRYNQPTELVTARGGLGSVGDLLPERCRSVMLVTGKRSARQFGCLDVARSSLEAAGRKVCVFDNVEEDPSVETADSASEFARQHEVDAVVGLGGGSAMDVAKAAAVCTAVNMDVREVVSAKPKPRGCIFLVEATPYALIADRRKRTKLNLATPDSFPDVALLDASLSVSMPETVTRDTGVDALCHAVEGYLNLRAQPFTDALAEAAIATVVRNIRAVMGSPENIEAREKMLIASNVAGCVIAHTGTSACHAMGYYLTLVHGVSHGLSNGLLLGPVMEWVRRSMPGKVARVEELVGGRMDDFLTSLGVDLSLASHGLSADGIDEMARSAAGRGSVKATPGVPTAEDLSAMLRARL